MGVVQLQILEPANAQSILGAPPVRFRGRLNGTAPAPMFFKWYSSLEKTTPGGAPLNVPADNPLDFSRALAVGSHVISFTARDVDGDAIADLQRVQHGGLAGGPQPPAPCIIHVLNADIQLPGNGALVSKANAELTARAPGLWGTQRSHQKNPDYHQLNQLQYRWRFNPLGDPTGRPSADFIMSDPEFDPTGAVPVLRYQGALPATLGTGAYRITLRVELISNPAVGHEASRDITLNP